MGTIRKIGSDYYIEFEARGLRYQQKAGPDEQAAWRLLEDVESKIRQGQMGIMVRDANVEIFLEDFLRDVTQHQPPHTQQRLAALVDHFKKFLKKKYPSLEKLSQVTPKVISDYKQQATTANPRLINFTLLLLKEILDYAIKLGYLNDNPVLHVRFAPDHRRSTVRIPSDKIATVLRKQANPSPMLGLIVETGLQWHEVTALRWQDISEDQSFLHVGRRQIPLTPAAREILQAQKSLSTKSDLVFPLTGIPPRDWQIFRHAFASRILKTGISLLRFHQLMGYTDIARVMRYFPWEEK